MEATSREFRAAIKQSHVVLSYVDLISPNNETRRLNATGGSVLEDSTATVRRHGTFSCADPLGDLEEILAQPGVELRPYRGIKFPDGTSEVCPLGVLRVSTTSLKDAVGGSRDISIEAFDLSRTIARDKFIAPYIIAAGTNVVTAIKNILGQTFANLEYDSISTTMSLTAPQFYDANTDPWDACTKLARSLGCELFFDARGRVVIAPPVDIDALPTPDFEYNEGVGCTMLDLAKKYTDEPGFNGVVLTGASIGDELPPVRSVVWDSEPTSRTYHLGPYGEVPMAVQDTIVKTQSEADNAATAILKGLLGASAQLTISASVNPALHAGDVVGVKRARSNVSGLYAIDGMSVPLRASETSSLTLRQKRTVT